MRKQEHLELGLPGGTTVKGSLFYQADPGATCVLYVHGFTSSRMGEKSRALENACARRGWSLGTFDFRGHGESSGTLLDLRASGLQDDLDQIVAYLSGRGVRRLLLVGSSMGGFASAWLALRRPDIVAACGFIAPALDFLGGFWRIQTPEQQGHWRRSGRLPVRNLARETDEQLDIAMYDEAHQFAFETLTTSWNTPVLIYHGMLDEVIPFQLSIDFLRQSTCPTMELRLIKDGDHRLHLIANTMAEAFCDFFQPWYQEV